MTRAAQLDLFDSRDYDAEARALAEWASHFEQVDWVAPWNCTDGTPKGTVRPGWRCPCCWDIEPNLWLLQNNHGITPEEIGRAEQLDECTALELCTNHAIYDRRQREKAGEPWRYRTRHQIAADSEARRKRGRR